MYQVWPVLPALASELLLPYSPEPMEPSIVGVVHCALTGATVATSIVRKRASFNMEARRMTNPRNFSDLYEPAATKRNVLISQLRGSG
jgi:hypothetical protein